MIDEGDLRNRFNYHPPSTPARQADHEDIRAVCLEVAMQINWLVPDGREKSLAITKLEEAMFWANAGLARSLETV